MQRYPILVLVGTSGSGKTSLLLEILKRFPGYCAPIKSKTTRAKRDEQDVIFYDFLSTEEFKKFEQEGRLFQTATFGGNHYGCDREQTDTTVTLYLGLVVLVQQSIADFEKAGYKLYLVHIVPVNHKPRTEPQRIKDDFKREKIALNYHAEIINDFTPGGFNRATQELSDIVQSLIDISPALSGSSVNH